MIQEHLLGTTPGTPITPGTTWVLVVGTVVLLVEVVPSGSRGITGGSSLTLS
jgi:hypothetical protein